LVHRITAADPRFAQSPVAEFIRHNGILHGLTPPQTWNGYLASGAYNTAPLEAARIEVVHHSAEDGTPEDIPVHMGTRKSIEPPIPRLDQGAKHNEETPAESERVSEEGILRVEKKIINWLEAVPNGMEGVAPSLESPAQLRTSPETQGGPRDSPPMAHLSSQKSPSCPASPLPGQDASLAPPPNKVAKGGSRLGKGDPHNWGQKSQTRPSKQGPRLPAQPFEPDIDVSLVEIAAASVLPEAPAPPHSPSNPIPPTPTAPVVAGTPPSTPPLPPMLRHTRTASDDKRFYEVPSIPSSFSPSVPDPPFDVEMNSAPNALGAPAPASSLPSTSIPTSTAPAAADNLLSSPLPPACSPTTECIVSQPVNPRGSWAIDPRLGSGIAPQWGVANVADANYVRRVLFPDIWGGSLTNGLSHQFSALAAATTSLQYPSGTLPSFGGISPFTLPVTKGKASGASTLTVGMAEGPYPFAAPPVTAEGTVRDSPSHKEMCATTLLAERGHLQPRVSLIADYSIENGWSYNISSHACNVVRAIHADAGEQRLFNTENRVQADGGSRTLGSSRGPVPRIEFEADLLKLKARLRAQGADELAVGLCDQIFKDGVTKEALVERMTREQCAGLGVRDGKQFKRFLHWNYEVGRHQCRLCSPGKTYKNSRDALRHLFKDHFSLGFECEQW
jgi:hypothetical protein